MRLNLKRGQFILIGMICSLLIHTSYAGGNRLLSSDKYRSIAVSPIADPNLGYLVVAVGADGLVRTGYWKNDAITWRLKLTLGNSNLNEVKFCTYYKKDSPKAGENQAIPIAFIAGDERFGAFYEGAGKLIDFSQLVLLSSGAKLKSTTIACDNDLDNNLLVSIGGDTLDLNTGTEHAAYLPFGVPSAVNPFNANSVHKFTYAPNTILANDSKIVDLTYAHGDVPTLYLATPHHIFTSSDGGMSTRENSQLENSLRVSPTNKETELTAFITSSGNNIYQFGSVTDLGASLPVMYFYSIYNNVIQPRVIYPQGQTNLVYKIAEFTCSKTDECIMNINSVANARTPFLRSFTAGNNNMSTMEFNPNNIFPRIEGTRATKVAAIPSGASTLYTFLVMSNNGDLYAFEPININVRNLAKIN